MAHWLRIGVGIAHLEPQLAQDFILPGWSMAAKDGYPHPKKVFRFSPIISISCLPARMSIGGIMIHRNHSIYLGLFFATTVQSA